MLKNIYDVNKKMLPKSVGINLNKQNYTDRETYTDAFFLQSVLFLWYSSFILSLEENISHVPINLMTSSLFNNIYVVIR